MIISRSIPVAANGIIAFFYMAKQYFMIVDFLIPTFQEVASVCSTALTAI